MLLYKGGSFRGEKAFKFFFPAWGGGIILSAFFSIFFFYPGFWGLIFFTKKEILKSFFKKGLFFQWGLGGEGIFWAGGEPPQTVLFWPGRTQGVCEKNFFSSKGPFLDPTNGFREKGDFLVLGF